jgi:hypothetical protein
MDTSDHYIVVEKMIRQGEVSKPELQLAPVGSPHRVTDIAAKWLAARVVCRNPARHIEYRGSSRYLFFSSGLMSF